MKHHVPVSMKIHGTTVSGTVEGGPVGVPGGGR
jgi:hypothetical protein